MSMENKYKSTSVMDPKLKDKWVKALRSGRYKQVQESLQAMDHFGNIAGNCCLGVLCRVARIKPEVDEHPEDRISCAFDGNEGELTARLRLDLGISKKDHDRLIEMNDGIGDFTGKTFPEIADFIEQNLGTK
jgi:hypothetical protein